MTEMDQGIDLNGVEPADEYSTSIANSDEIGKAVDEGPKAKITFLMLIGAILASMQAANLGLCIGLTNQSTGVVTEHFGTDPNGGAWSWVVSCFAAGGILGGVVGGPVTGWLGPKKTQLINNVFFIACGLTQAFAPTLGVLMLGRFFGGIGGAIACSCTPIWISECSPTHARGIFGVFFQLFCTLGIFAQAIIGMDSTLGTPSGWRIQYGACLVPAAVHMLGFWFMPDTPRFLVVKNNIDGATKALKRLRGANFEIHYELMSIQTAVEDERSQALGQIKQYKMLFSKQFIKQTMMAIGLQIGQQMSGINAIMFYSGQIFVQAGMDDAQTATIITMAVNVAATFIAIPLIDRLGRRWLLLIGFGGMGVWHLLFGLGIIFDWGVAAIAFMLLGVVCFAIGPGPIPWMVTSEIFPGNVRSAGVGIAVLTNWIFTFAVGLFWTPLQKAAGASAFFFFMGCCVFITAFVFFAVPETKGKTIEEVQAVFAGRRKFSTQPVMKDLQF